MSQPASACGPNCSRLIPAHGSSLVDALIAIALVAAITAGVSYLVLWGRRAAWASGITSVAVTLATQKIERLQSLSWDVDSTGVPISDTTTNLSTEPADASGSGLQPSPAGTLATNTPGFVDYLDADGQWRGTGVRPVPGAAFVRRWSIESFPGDPANTLVFAVVVLPLVDAVMGSAGAEQGVRLVTIKTRVTR